MAIAAMTALRIIPIQSVLLAIAELLTQRIKYAISPPITPRKTDNRYHKQDL
jgi:hypothetical protein